MSFTTGVSVAALALVLGVAGAAGQQGPPQTRAEPPGAPVTGQIMAQPEQTMLARDFLGQAVLAQDNSKIGTITDLLLTKDGRTVEGFIVSVGGFLGIGERSVALRMDRLQIVPGSDSTLKLVTDLKREDLANAPAFKSRRDIEAEKRAIERSMQPKPGDGPQR
jgi:sporulation protein YlmC with PRC-barrel domain